MEFLAVIPARYASTRFPGKPLVRIGDHTMIEMVYRRTNSFFKNCCVATDDARIAAEVRRFGGNVVMTSAAHNSGTDRCAEALAITESETGCSIDVVVNVQGDEPLMCTEHLELIGKPFCDERVEIATLVKPFSQQEDIFNPNTPKVVLSAHGYVLYFSRNVIPYCRGVESTQWQSSHLFYKHIGIYAYRADTLRQITRLPQSSLEKAESLEQLRWLENGYLIKAEVTQQESIAVDTPQDLERIRQILRNSF